MESSDSFYVTVSGVSNNFDYNHFFPEKIDLYADWEVGLQQIILNGNYFSALHSESRKVYIRKKGEIPYHVLRLKSNAIDNLTSFIQALKNAFETSEFKDKVKVVFQQNTGVFVFKVDEEYEVRLSDHVSIVLSLEQGTVFSGEYLTVIPSQTYFPPPQFFLKTEIVGASILSEEKVQNLKTICLNPDWKTKGLQAQYNPIEYHQLKVKDLQELRLALVQFSGTEIFTTFSIATFVLHFRKRLKLKE